MSFDIIRRIKGGKTASTSQREVIILKTVFPDALAAAQFSVCQSRHCLNLLLLIKKRIKGLPAMRSVK